MRTVGRRDFVFAHNGTLRNTRQRAAAAPFEPIGETDSEQAFCELLAEHEANLRTRDWRKLFDGRKTRRELLDRGVVFDDGSILRLGFQPGGASARQAALPPRDLVSDLFAGSNTTREAADSLGRRWLLCATAAAREIAEDVFYHALAVTRTVAQQAVQSSRIIGIDQPLVNFGKSRIASAESRCGLSKRISLSIGAPAWCGSSLTQSQSKTLPQSAYQAFKPRPTMRWVFVPVGDGAASYETWPPLADLFPVHYSGLNENRQGALMSGDRGVLERRMRRYFDRSVTDDQIAEECPALIQDAARRHRLCGAGR